MNETAWQMVQEDIPFGGGKMLFPPYTEKTKKILNLMKKFM
ncbi:hypothetical protein MNBD_ALPHA03-322 [hydrothermal vent metagenome]|uniref:Uncharacterized protein n=1 Tax=hydrothermal vent metagenome TaxID=652676 RepID=A0A3B1B4H2_9ZZZZ